MNASTDSVVRLDPSDPRATVCGVCGAAWDDSVSTSLTPVPAGRCPFEADHGPIDHTGETVTLHRDDYDTLLAAYYELAEVIWNSNLEPCWVQVAELDELVEAISDRVAPTTVEVAR